MLAKKLMHDAVYSILTFPQFRCLWLYRTKNSKKDFLCQNQRRFFSNLLRQFQNSIRFSLYSPAHHHHHQLSLRALYESRLRVLISLTQTRLLTPAKNHRSKDEKAPVSHLLPYQSFLSAISHRASIDLFFFCHSFKLLCNQHPTLSKLSKLSKLFNFVQLCPFSQFVQIV